MIIETDFLDHWKTKALVELTQRPESPLWLMRLWAHCQVRKAWRFRDLPPIAIKSICGVPHEIDADKWVQILCDCRFLDRNDDALEVHGWREINSKLVANWKNGNKRKRKPSPSQSEANDNPSQSQSDLGASDRLDREDRLDKGEKMEGKPGARPSLAEAITFFQLNGSTQAEGEKFFNHFEANGWKQSKGKPIVKWPAAAKNWLARAGEFSASSRSSGVASEKSSGMAPAGPFDPSKPNAHTRGVEVVG